MKYFSSIISDSVLLRFPRELIMVKKKKLKYYCDYYKCSFATIRYNNKGA
jgi:hypothetical protein